MIHGLSRLFMHTLISIRTPTGFSPHIEGHKNEMSVGRIELVPRKDTKLSLSLRLCTESPLDIHDDNQCITMWIVRAQQECKRHILYHFKNDSKVF